MTAIKSFLSVAACKHCYSGKQLLIVDPVGQAHPNQLLNLKLNLEQVKVHIIVIVGKYNVDPKSPLYLCSVYASHWIFAKNNIDLHP